jgi:hypothetical protein
MLIAFHPLTKRHVADSHFTHWTISNDEVMKRVLSEVDGLGEQPDPSKPLILSIPPAAFYSPMVKLVRGDSLVGKYDARHGQDEEPRVEMSVVRPGAEKLAAGKVEVIRYSHEMLESSGDASSDADWEIITIEASADGSPIHPTTLIANHLGLSGGTDHGLSDAEFVEQLRISVPFHNAHAKLAPAPKEEVCQGGSRCRLASNDG